MGTQASTTTNQPVESITPTAVKLDELAEELNASHEMRAEMRAGLSHCIWNGRIQLCKRFDHNALKEEEEAGPSGHTFNHVTIEEVNQHLKK